MEHLSLDMEQQVRDGEETKCKSIAANYTAKKQNIILGRKNTWNSTSTTRTCICCELSFLAVKSNLFLYNG